jgi:hypothetical protein
MALRKTQKQVLVWAQHTIRAGEVRGFASDHPELKRSDDYNIYDRAWATWYLKRHPKPSNANELYAYRAAHAVILFTN